MPMTDDSDVAVILAEDGIEGGEFDSIAIPVATLVAEEAKSGECCSNCQKQLARDELYCRRCGFYPKLGITVEVDPWELEPAVVTVAAVPQKATKFSPMDLLRAIPRWGWIMILGTLAIVLFSLMVRSTVPQGPLRYHWTWAQSITGTLLFVLGHVLCCFVAITHCENLHPLDFFLKPWMIWGASIRELPTSYRRLSFLLWGEVLTLSAFFIVGGIQFNSLIDWGPVPPKKNLMKAITEQAKKMAEEGDSSLVDSLDQVADNSAGDGSDTPKTDPAKLDPRTKLQDCVIIGFIPFRETDFSSLILAADIKDNLQYVGTVSEGITPEVRGLLNKKMRKMLRATPFVKCELHGFWLEPKLTCAVSSIPSKETKHLVRPKFNKLLAELP